MSANCVYLRALAIRIDLISLSLCRCLQVPPSPPSHRLAYHNIRIPYPCARSAQTNIDAFSSVVTMARSFDKQRKAPGDFCEYVQNSLALRISASSVGVHQGPWEVLPARLWRFRLPGDLLWSSSPLGWLPRTQGLCNQVLQGQMLCNPRLSDAQFSGSLLLSPTGELLSRQSHHCKWAGGRRVPRARWPNEH